MHTQARSQSREAHPLVRIPPHLTVFLAVSTAITSLLLLLGLAFAGPRPAYAAGPICRVDGSNLSPGTGGSWLTAYSDLQDALPDSGCTEIWVAAGVYTPGTLVEHTFQLTNSVSIYGGFTATETLRSERNPEANITVLSGDIDDNDTKDANGVITDTEDIMGNNSYHVVTGSGTNSTAVLDGFTITGGNARGISNQRGGGMYIDSGSPSLTNLTFIGNTAEWDGGGMYNNQSSPALTSITFSGNSAVSYSGGGMYNNQSSPALTDTNFINNTADYLGGGMYNDQSSNPTLTSTTFISNSARYGGGMSNNQSNPTLTNLSFLGNSADWYGGGMYNELSSPALTAVSFNGNSADRRGGGMYNELSSPALTSTTFIINFADWDGGGMFNRESNPALTNTTFISNSATNNGGGMFNKESSPALTSITFISNSAIDDGGGMFNRESSNPALTNVTFSGNSVTDHGGGIFNLLNSNPALVNVTLSGNSATDDGGGVYNRGSSPTIQNSILWNNKDSSGTGTITATIANDPNFINPSTPVISYTLVQGSGGSSAWNGIAGTDGGNNFDSDPLFVSPVNPSTAPTTTGDLRLNDGSPAIDAGDSSAVSTSTDLDGNPRIVGSGVDMGAYEHNYAPQFTSAAVTTATEDSPYTYNITTNDLDLGDTRTISASTKPDWLTLTDNGNGTASLSGTPTNQDVGGNPVSLLVEDAYGLTGTQSFNISVTTVTVPNAADLSISINDGVDSIPAGSDTTYTIMVTNNGPEAVSGATVSAVLPAELENVTWTCIASAGSSCTTSGSGSSLNDTANLPAGGTATYSLTAKISDSALGSLAATAVVTPPAGILDPNTGNNTASDNTTVLPPIPVTAQNKLFLPITVR